VENLESLIKEAFDKGYKDVFVADSLEDLAEKTKIDAGGLKETVKQYNRFCEKGMMISSTRVIAFSGRSKPPSSTLRGFCQRLRDTGRNQDQPQNRSPEQGMEKDPRTLCRGNGCLYDLRRQLRVRAPGNTMGFAINSGRIAGENALEYIKSGS